MDNIPNEHVEDLIIHKRERLMNIVYPTLSDMKGGDRVFQNILIIDLINISIWKIFNSKLKAFLKNNLSIGNRNYPEMTKKIFFVNAPYLFTGVWKFISIFMDKRTVKKASISSGPNTKELLEYIDKSNLPKCLGGDCELPLGET